MAISGAAVWEVRSTATASNVNGGFFVTGATGTDYSQQNAAQYALTGGTSAGAGSTILHASAAADMVGNGLHLISGTNATAGWYEVISVSVGISITVDRAVTTGAGASIVFNIGGAMSLGSADDALFESLTAGNVMWIKGGSSITYTLGGAVTIAAAGTSQKPIMVNGYNSVRGDNPTGATRPTLDSGGNGFTYGANWEAYYMIQTGSGSTFLSVGTSGKFVYSKAVNPSTTAARIAITCGNSALIDSCEVICYRGVALNASSVGVVVTGCYIHDSDIGLKSSATTAVTIYDNNIIADNVTHAVEIITAKTGSSYLLGNTIYGAENKLGIGFSIATGTTNAVAINNIFYGFVTGISHADVQTVSYSDYNDFNNNTTNTTNWATGPHTITSNPTFTNVTQIKGTAATTSGSVLTDGAANFSSVVDNQDFVYIVSGTGITAGKYLITAHTTTTITLSSAPGTSAVADKVWQITLGHNFAVGTNMSGIGFPAALPAALSTGYPDVGAVQRQPSINTYSRGRVVNVKT